MENSNFIGRANYLTKKIVELVFHQFPIQIEYTANGNSIGYKFLYNEGTV